MAPFLCVRSYKEKPEIADEFDSSESELDTSASSNKTRIVKKAAPKPKDDSEGSIVKLSKGAVTASGSLLGAFDLCSAIDFVSESLLADRNYS